jgi:uncharacterized protein (TIGR04222 family)
MVTLGAAGDTWGISGPDFLRVYLLSLAAFVVVAILFRFSTRLGRSAAQGQPSAAELAYLADGPRQAIYASLAALRTGDAIRADGRRISQSGPMPAGLDRLDHAIYDAAGVNGIGVRELARDPGVRAALAELATATAQRGWGLDPSARFRGRLGGLLLLALAGFGVVRVAAGMANNRPVSYLVLLVIGTALLAVWFLLVPRMSPAGRAALKEARSRNYHLSPRQSPAWSTYGPTGVAMGVALFGSATLWSADPAFASAAGLQRYTSGAGYAGSSGYTGSSCGGSSGGSSCGGGGGGGGGCGG